MSFEHEILQDDRRFYGGTWKWEGPIRSNLGKQVSTSTLALMLNWSEVQEFVMNDYAHILQSAIIEDTE